MNMSDLSPAQDGAPDDEAVQAVAQSWRDIIRQVGEEVAEPLTGALERVTELIATGRIDRQSLRELRNELERARHAGIVSQQLARIAGGGLRQARERLQLPQMLKDMLALRQRDLQARGLVARPVVAQVDVQADPTLLFALLNAALDWTLTHAEEAIEIRVDRKLWPEVARVRLRFSPRTLPAASQFGSFDDVPLDPLIDQHDLNWHLLERTALAIGVRAERVRENGEIVLTLEFPPEPTSSVEGMSVVELDHGFSASTHSRPISGSHVLVIAARRAVRVDVRDAIRNMGLVIDLVNSLEEAQAFCRKGAPDAIIVESALRGEHFDDLQADLLAKNPEVAFVEIIEEGDVFEVSGFSATSMAKVGRDAIASGLPSALAYELSKGL